MCHPPGDIFDTRLDESAIGRLAAHQHGIVTARQLAARGLGRNEISRRVAAGRLHRVHHGVYAVGHPILTRHGHWIAAVLACGPDAALSHTSAAALWEIRPTDAARIDVTVPSTGGRARPGLRIHRTPTLRPAAITPPHAIAVTTPTRTLLDLAATLPRRALEKALDQAEIRQLFDLTALDAIARAHARHHGTARLQDALASHRAGTTLTRSELEERFLALCERHYIPRPRVNHRIADLEVDFHFPAHRLVVEVDGYRYHHTRTAFERDRHRDAILAQAGYRVLRFSHRQVTREPAQVAAALRSSA
jgi:very-short-patch-repair endonuclease/predicted transcriptional regulator of viral defense system